MTKGTTTVFNTTSKSFAAKKDRVDMLVPPGVGILEKTYPELANELREHNKKYRNEVYETNYLVKMTDETDQEFAIRVNKSIKK